MDLEINGRFEESGTKKQQEQGEASGATLMTDAQMDCIIVTVTTTTTASEAQLKKQPIEGFEEVNTRVSSLVDAILRRVSKENIFQKEGEIRRGKWVWIVQLSPHVIENNTKDFNASLQQSQELSLDFNELSTQTSVQLQRVVSQELVDQEHIIGDHLLNPQEQEEATLTEI